MKGWETSVILYYEIDNSQEKISIFISFYYSDDYLCFMNCNNMRIDKIQTNKKEYLDMLLLADEQESMIDKYLEKGEMFVMFNAVNEAVCSAVVTDEGCDICELKNLAVTPQYQRRGYGKRMINYLCNHYADKFRYMTVGTGDSVKTVSFYESCGFSYSHSIPDFFTHSYDHLIIEEGKILKDMLYFKKALFSISPDIEMQK